MPLAGTKMNDNDKGLKCAGVSEQAFHQSVKFERRKRVSSHFKSAMHPKAWEITNENGKS